MNRIVNAIMCLLLLLFLSSSLIASTTDAEVFDIGENVSESDENYNGHLWHIYDSGAVIRSHKDYEDYAPLIFDGNVSTGIDHNFGPDHQKMAIFLDFPYPYFINNITFKPIYNGNASNYVHNGSVWVYTGHAKSLSFNLQDQIEETIQFNCNIKTIRLWLDSNGTDHYYYNDVIINYTKQPTDLDEILNSIDAVNKRINELNKKLNNTNISNEMIWENITNFWDELDKLNRSFQEISYEYYNLNNSYYENITRINNDITYIENNIYNIESKMINLSTNNSKIPKLQGLLDQVFLDIEHLYENITDIRDNLPDAFNDTDLKNRISDLEANNTELDDKIANLTKEIDNLKGSVKGKQVEDQQYDYSFLALFLIVIIFITFILSSIIFRKRQETIEASSEFSVLNNIMMDAINNSEVNGQQLSNEEIKIKLEEKYQRGIISKEVYDYSMSNLSNQDLNNNPTQNENIISGTERKS